MTRRVTMEAFMDVFCKKETSLQPITPKTHLSAINASIVKTGMQNIAMRILARLRLRIEKFVELRRSRPLRIIARNKMQFPTKDARKIAVKKTIMATLSPTVNLHLTLKQERLLALVMLVLFILRRF